MSSNRKAFRNAYKKFDALLEAGHFSEPADVGRVAILCSYWTYKDDKGRPNAKEIKAFRKESFALAEMIEEGGSNTEVVLNCKRSDFDAVLLDPAISDIITIGHGNISALALPDDAGGCYDYDWRDVAINTDHLKLGGFEQRQCGNFREEGAPVPLGLFAIRDARDLSAPFGEYFNPQGLNHPDNEMVVKVFEGSRADYDTIKKFPDMHLSIQLSRIPDDLVILESNESPIS